MKHFLLFFLWSFLFNQASAQKINFGVRVSDSHGQPIEYCAVRLLREDTTVVFVQTTDSIGHLNLSLDSFSTFRLVISSVGFQTYTLFDFRPKEDSLYDIVLAAATNQLKAITVKQKKPLLRQEEDKTIVDAEQLSEASTNAYEVLEKTPGLFIDQDGNIYISSLSPAQVYINGRELKMSRSDIATMLKNLPPSSIEKIEILRTPSAKFDASGSGGVVNIILKKGVSIGLNGSVHAGIQQGVYGNQFVGFGLNHNEGKWSSYLSANTTLQNNYQQLNTDRVLQGDTLLRQTAFTKYPSHAFYTNLGTTYSPNDHWSISSDTRISLNGSQASTSNNNDIQDNRTNSVLLSTLSLVDNITQTLLFDQSFSSKYKIDTLGSEWNTTLAYTYAHNNLDQVYRNSSLLQNSEGIGTVLAQRNFVVVQSDYNLKMKHQIQFETGIKATLLWFKNDAQYFNGLGWPKQTDFLRSNRYQYYENINAAYVQAAKSFQGYILKSGVRFEQTNMQGKQLRPSDTSFELHRSDLFPYVYLSKKIMAIAGYDLRAYLVYRRTISRPTYEQLNPFPKYLDQFMSEMGNPSLRPQFSNNYEFNISVNEHPLLALGYNDTRDLFTNVFYQADSTVAQAFRGYDNVGSNREVYVRGLAAIPPGGIYFAVLGGQCNLNHYAGLYQGQPLDFRATSWLFFTYHQLKLGKKFMLTFNGFWRPEGPLQFYELTPMGSLSCSINRKFLKDKLTVTLNTTDIFYTNNNEFIVRQGNVSASGSRATDSRRYGLNVRYNFGFHKKEDKANMFEMVEEEKK